MKPFFIRIGHPPQGDEPGSQTLRSGALLTADSKEAPLRSNIFTREELALHASRLALQHRISDSPKVKVSLFGRFEENRRIIDRAYAHFSELVEKGESLTAGAEWLLDNKHVITQQVRNIRVHFPSGYYRTLPKLTEGPLANYPRVYHIALELVTHTDAVLSRDVLTTFVQAYQRHVTLTIGELWAVPIMLRLALIENLRRLAAANLAATEKRRRAEKLLQAITPKHHQSSTQVLLNLGRELEHDTELLLSTVVYLIRNLRARGKEMSLAVQWLEERCRERGHDPDGLVRLENYAQAANQISIGNTITSLRTVSDIDWEDWFEEHSAVDAILRKDPEGSYGRSDFRTRDHYRHHVEKLARKVRIPETEVASTALGLASRSDIDRIEPAEERLARKHIGYYLVDAGWNELTKELRVVSHALYNVALKQRLVLYVGSILLFALGFTLLFASMAGLAQTALSVKLGISILLFLSLTEPALDFVQFVISRFTTPHIMPQLEFKDALPEHNRTFVTVHSILYDRESIRRLVENLEIRFIGNEDPNIFFGLLADLPDAASETTPQDSELREHAVRLVNELNIRYGTSGREPFYLMLRSRKWNPGEKKFMGWERKRGKVVEFNRLILGDTDTSFEVLAGKKEGLQDIRYVITLDADSLLPRGSAKKLIGAIAHPLHAPRFNDKTNVVKNGYSVIQPRVTVSLPSSNYSLFSKTFSTSPGLDPYTHAVSEVYQDVFAEGTYVGKGIYDVRAFERAVSHRVPENALLSHDLFEGNFARVGLASHIELIDDFPPRFNVYARREHRWVRGDWQLLPWLFPRIPNDKRESYPNPISGLGKWKLTDNLRRSLLYPATFALLVISSFEAVPFPSALVMGVLLFFLMPTIISLINIAIGWAEQMRSRATILRSRTRDLIKSLCEAAFAITFLPYLAWLMVHAIGITLYRLYISKRNLLEWQSAYSAERRLGGDLRSFFYEMLPGTLITIALGIGVLLYGPVPASWALPFLVLWFSSPFLAYRVSQADEDDKPDLSREARRYLHGVAYETWCYFDDLIAAERNFLIPDNVQLDPVPVVAERTSPTNIGFSVVAILSARDCGFHTVRQMLERTCSVFDALSRLERYQGHFLNWYDTRSLVPLAPRYVSMVDSGNLVATLLVVRETLGRIASEDLLSSKHIEHLRFLGARIESSNKELSEEQRKVLARIRGLDTTAPSTVEGFCKTCHEVLELAHILERLTGPPYREVVPWEKSPWVRLQVAAKGIAELHTLSGFVDPLSKLRDQIASVGTLSKQHAELNDLVNLIKASPPRLSRLRLHLPAAQKALVSLEESAPESMRPLLQEVKSAVEQGFFCSEDLTNQVHYLIGQIDEMVKSCDFRFLFDSDKKLFSIGFNVDASRRDNSFYDLLTSEARLGSLVAIAKGDVPERHWFVLGRSLTHAPGGTCLISWSGTMFEYLMPLALTKSFPDTLLWHSCRAAVSTQRLYGIDHSVPWGISESSYSGVNFEKTYQYKAFGVPALGLKRGLDHDLVISPYSSLLALLVAPRQSYENLLALERRGARGAYGFYEAIDYTAERLSREEESHIVRSFFAHHQGMSFAALNNVLHDSVLQERFHSNPLIKATELLLQEKFPDRVAMFVTPPPETAPSRTEDSDERAWRAETISTPHTPIPRTRVISNGHYSVMLDNAGSGQSFFERDISLTRWREDPTCHNRGTFIYIRDREKNRVWSTAYQPTLAEPEHYEVIFNPDKVEFKRTDFDIHTHTEVTVSPEDPVEIRRVHLTNLAAKKRTLELTSYAEVALAPHRADSAHPAFSKMSIQSEFLPERDALLFSRRPRSHNDQPLYLLHMVTQKVVWEQTQYDTSRYTFLGRGRSAQDPVVFSDQRKLARTTGAVLDPVFALRTVVDVEPGETQSVTFITSVSRDRNHLLQLMQRYHELYYVQRAFEMSWSQSNVELRHEAYSIGQTHVFQHLANGLYFNIEKWRGAADSIARNRLTQSGLWRFGISGDIPLVLVRINDAEQLKLLRELILAHHYLRIRGVTFDLVVLNEYPGGYMQDLQNEIETLVRSSYLGGMIDKSGGIFLRTQGQLSNEEVDLIEAVARIVLHGPRGSLSKQLQFEEQAAEVHSWWRFPSGVKPEEFSPYEIPKLDYEFFNGTGGFIEEGNAYAVEIRKGALPPVPWSNVIANPRFGFLCTEAGSGYTWSENSRENHLSPWSNDPVTDPQGEAIYLRDAATGHFWSPTPAPASRDDSFLVKHRVGSTEYMTQIRGIFSSLKVQAALEDPIKWWDLHVVNGHHEAKTIEVFLYVEWTLGFLREDSYRHLVSAFDPQAQLVHVSNYYNNEFAGRVVFVGSTADLASFSTNRAEFLGRNGSYAAPMLLDRSSQPARPVFGAARSEVRLSKQVGAGFDSAATLKVVLELQPGESRDLSFFFGEVPAIEQARSLARRYRGTTERKAENEKVRDFWNTQTKTIQVRTPNRSLDIMMNTWLIYQTISCRLFGRSAFYQNGGAQGFRDQLQDVMALLYADPGRTRSQILLHASRQFTQGDVQHWWHPPTGRGVRTKISDDYLWLPYVVDRYLSVTGDQSIWEEKVPYIEGQFLEGEHLEAYIYPTVSNISGSIYEHCLIALDRSLTVGPHGLPLIGCGDWNDGFNEVGRSGKGESVWLAWFLCQLLKRFIPIVEARRDSYRSEEYKKHSESLRAAIEREAWDGAWYRRAFFDDGTPLGSSANDECQIDSLAQSWSVISESGDKQRSLQAMQELNRRLVKDQDKLILLLTPPFNDGPLRPGYIKGYLPGVRENGAQYTHAAAWAILAEAMLGHGKRAQELWNFINPVNHTLNEEGVKHYQGEPYVTCGDVYSVPPHVGRAGWSWYTGSSAWIYRVALENMIGFKLTPAGFYLDPCISPEWDNFGMQYTRAGVTYDITVTNPERLEKGTLIVKLNDTLCVDGLVPFVEPSASNRAIVSATLKK